MVMVFVTLISRTSFTEYTIENVPANLKAAVLDILKKMGLDGYGKPIGIE